MQKEMIKTNADSLVGQHAIVTSDISLDQRGEVKINAVYWVAFVTKDIKIEEGSKVIILGIEGNKLLVEPIKGGE
jgi:membrane protein implicated in regulation of membrane protease activity